MNLFMINKIKLKKKGKESDHIEFFNSTPKYSNLKNSRLNFFFNKDNFNGDTYQENFKTAA